MKNPKAGDRVAIYEHSARLIGCISEVLSANQCMVITDRGGQFAAHVKQLRRLVPKKRREYWIVTRESGMWLVFGSARDADESAGLNDEVIHVREVKP